MNVTISLPPELVRAMRDAKLPVSSICKVAIEEALSGTSSAARLESAITRLENILAKRS